MYIIIVVALLLLVPTILCTVLFIKIHNLEKELAVLKVMHTNEYEEYSNLLTPDSSTIVHAAQKDDSSPITQETTGIEEQNITNLADTEENQNNENQTSHSTVVQVGKEQLKAPKDSEEKRKVYLTFDDGPSIYTDEILDILAEYNVKATFFVLGKTDEKSKERYKRIVEEGHTLGMHSYSHRYDYIYKSTKNFREDFDKISELLYQTTGVRPVHYRFPGGSSNTVNKVNMRKLIAFLNKEKIIYHDWNVESGDAASKPITEKKLIKNVIDGIGTKKVSVVLLHDTSTKVSTVKALPKLIEKLIEENCEILPIDDQTSPVQHIKADTVKE